MKTTIAIIIVSLIFAAIWHSLDRIRRGKMAGGDVDFWSVIILIFFGPGLIDWIWSLL